MKNYLSFGGGVNSVAMYLYLADEGWDFEAVFVDHGTDWPETYEYIEMFKKQYSLTIIKPQNRGSKPMGLDHLWFDNLYEYSYAQKMFPSRVARWCTHRFKKIPLDNYHKRPCFVFIGFDWDEKHRARIYSQNGEEYRYPLIEAEIGRDECEEIIKHHGLPIPMKSGCYICPFQRVGELRKLRKIHPELFCKLERLENRNNEERKRLGKNPYYSFKRPVREVAEKDIGQLKLWEKDEYPPCECML
jgi:3'-phosphoadenosine 5'-phosphosulfate sulfotransferase (PAPS reductase)/FAD synthetase